MCVCVCVCVCVQDDGEELKVLLMGVSNGTTGAAPAAADAALGGGEGGAISHGVTGRPSLGSSDFLIASGRVHMKVMIEGLGFGD